MADYEVIAEGTGSDVATAAEAEAKLKPGTKVEYRLYVNGALTPAQLADIQSNLLSQGVVLDEPLAYDSGVVVIRYTTSPAPPSDSIGIVWFIPVIAGVVALAGVGIFAWQMARQSGNLLSNPLLIFSAVAVVIVYFMMKPDKDKDKTEEQPR